MNACNIMGLLSEKFKLILDFDKKKKKKRLTLFSLLLYRVFSMRTPIETPKQNIAMVRVLQSFYLCELELPSWFKKNKWNHGSLKKKYFEEET